MIFSGGAVRRGAVWIATTLGTTGLALLALPVLRSTCRPQTFEDLLVGVAAAALLVCASWWWCVTTLVVIVPAGPGLCRLAPAWARAVVLGACGVAVAVSTPATAASGHPGPAHQTPTSPSSVLDGLPLPDRATGAEAARSGPSAPDLIVRPGDSLWRICVQNGPAGATAAQVADDVRRLYAANRGVIGPDPDLIQPGQHLRGLLEQETPDR